MASMSKRKFLKQRLKSLQTHLQEENPGLVEVLPTYYKLDKVLYAMGLIERDSSLATRISWWPLVSILGTFSSGKSSFINYYLGEGLQQTGNQAVDDKFTVVCYRSADQNRTLPGTALDADPRFPFFRMSEEIEKVAKGEGRRIEAYLQLKTTSAEAVRGRILIDSPGFDADDQRRSTLRITDHIIDLSDLVLIFFDARHPEPGAMHDTLHHLVSKTVRRADASKFLYVLNQIDTTAKEDNPEQVVGAWQRAIAQAGLTAGRFFTIYNPDAAVPIDDEPLRRRFETKRDADIEAMFERMDEVEVQRSYRVVGMLETVCNELETGVVPRLQDALARWRKGVLIGDGLYLVAVAALAVAAIATWGRPSPDAVGAWVGENRILTGITLAAVGIAVLSFHLWLRDWVGKRVARTLPAAVGKADLSLRNAFMKSTRFPRSVFRSNPAGWGGGAVRRLQAVREFAAQHVQRLNDTYTDPSGKKRAVGRPSATLEPHLDTSRAENERVSSFEIRDGDTRMEGQAEPARLER